jgi:hypothetical protein
MNQNFPSLADFRSFMVNQLGSVEVIRQSLYDTQLYPTAGQTRLAFFQLPIGQGLSASPGNANAAKALTDTNMQLGGQLPAPQGFWIQSVEVDFQPGSVNTANTFTIQPPTLTAAAAGVGIQCGEHDVNNFYNAGALALNIGQKVYLQEAPLLWFPPKCRFELDTAVAQNSATTTLWGKVKMKAGGRPYILDPGLALMTSQNFDITLTWPVVVATPSGFNGAVRVILDGWLFRAVQ